MTKGELKIKNHGLYLWYYTHDGNKVSWFYVLKRKLSRFSYKFVSRFWYNRLRYKIREFLVLERHPAEMFLKVHRIIRNDVFATMENNEHYLNFREYCKRYFKSYDPHYEHVKNFCDKTPKYRYKMVNKVVNTYYKIVQDWSSRVEFSEEIGE